MSERPTPLPPGTLLHARFEVEEVLGQGDFGIVYRARDRIRGDLCVVRELAPQEARRTSEGFIELPHLGEAAAQRLRQQFRQEARKVMRLSGPALLPLRAAFQERGTAYLVRDYVPEAVTLAQHVALHGSLPPERVAQILTQLSEALEQAHLRGVLHLDLRPSNVLLSGDLAFLVDFGEARKWYRDLARIERSAEALPPEVESRGARVTPQADIYGLASTLYFALSGFIPPRAWPQFGEILNPLHNLQPDVPRHLAEALGRGLQVDPHERPRTARQFIEMATGQGPKLMEGNLVELFDEKALELKRLRFDRRQCPSCGGVLENPKPLKPNVCPVCREGRIVTRKIVRQLCPNCRMGMLRPIENTDPLAICPICAKGLLHKRRKRLLSKEWVYSCDECEAGFERNGPNLSLTLPPAGSDLPPGTVKTAEEWRAASGRASNIFHCRGCGTQFDVMPDGRWRQAVPAKTGKFDELDPLEWARVAAGLPPDSGNAECEACGADYFAEGELVALLETRFDPHHFAEHNTGRIVTFNELRWLGVGKESPNSGLVCADCGTELDFDDDKLVLVRGASVAMHKYPGQAMTLENWHRAAHELPLVGEEKGFEEAFGIVLREAYTTGKLPFSSKEPRLIWQGPAKRLPSAREPAAKPVEGTLTVAETEIRHGGMVKKWTLAMDGVERVSTEGARLDLALREGGHQFLIEPVELTAHLASGSRSIRLEAPDLCARIRLELSLRDKGEG
jgi:serine/threonine protein kinase